MRPPDYHGIDEATRRIDGHVQLLQIVRCSCAACEEKIEMLVKAERKPPDVIFKIARQKKWAVNPGKRIFRCPEHAREH